MKLKKMLYMGLEKGKLTVNDKHILKYPSTLPVIRFLSIPPLGCREISGEDAGKFPC